VVLRRLWRDLARPAKAHKESKAELCAPEGYFVSAETLAEALSRRSLSARIYVSKTELRLLLGVCGGALVLVAGLFQAELIHVSSRLDQLLGADRNASSATPQHEPPKNLSPLYSLTLKEFEAGCSEAGGTYRAEPVACQYPDGKVVQGELIVVFAEPLASTDE
jgi:hypothetical protein